LESRLLLVVVVPQERLALARKDTRDPRVLVRGAPESDSDAAHIVEARLENVGVHFSLDLELRSLVAGRSVEPDVELGVGNVHAEVREQRQSGIQRAQARGDAASGGSGRLRGQVALKADAVDACAVGLDQLYDAGGALGLLGAIRQVVVVVKEAGVRVGGLSVLKRDGDVGLTDGPEEDVVAVGAVFIEGCVA
jgi:hypothetical protein